MTARHDKATETPDDLAGLKEAFKDLVGYLHAYRKGAPAGPEVGWAIRRFNEEVDALHEEQA